jgi:hypothetical protein
LVFAGKIFVQQLGKAIASDLDFGGVLIRHGLSSFLRRMRITENYGCDKAT